MTLQIPILYTFRRCPYAMRARLALLFSETQFELREVVLKNKPAQMLAISPKGTVPVLQLGDESVIDESHDIMLWVLNQQDPYHLLRESNLEQSNQLIDKNDDQFKYWLDRYKYADRYPEMSQESYRQKGELFIQELEAILENSYYLLGNDVSITDIGIMPFVRQFAHVDREVFYSLPYPNVQRWLKHWLEHPLFLKAMTKYSPWKEE